jgi:2'-5' RNA ligase
MAASPAPSTASKPARLFLALWPDAALRAALARQRDAWQWPGGASPVLDERLHVTLHFLGNVDAALLPQLTQALALPFTPFTLTFGTPVLWHAGIAVLEPVSAPPELFDLHARLGAALRAVGLPTEERPYRPHVTLARRAGKASVPAMNECQLDWQTDSYALVQSDGGVYTVLRTYAASS